MKKLRVALIFGGRSAEHEVSLRSAKSIYAALNRDKYDVVPVAIDRKGAWQIGDSSLYLESDTSKEVVTHKGDLVPALSDLNKPFDVAFPIIHGPYGEDGTLQGMLKLANIPFVGPSVLGSAVGMDKDVMKRLLRDAGIDIPKFMVFNYNDTIIARDCFQSLGSTLYIKPANMGSSVGVTRVTNEDELLSAIKFAFQFDSKVMVEEGVTAREIEVSVLGNANPEASIPGEIKPKSGFYDYDTKYVDANAAELLIPAPLTPTQIKRCQEIAIKTFKVLCCEGMGRVDMFLTPDDRILINEINTLPGFTSISMYPKLWEASGLSYSALIDKLIELAIERHNRENRYLVKPNAD